MPKTQTEQSKNKKTNKKPSSQTEKKDDADIEKPQNTTGADQNKTDDTKAQDGADKESDTKNSTQKKPTQRNSTKKNSTKKNSTVQKLSLIHILDINLPDGSGYDFLGHVRTASSVPVIMLTANDMEIDEVRGIAVSYTHLDVYKRQVLSSQWEPQ